MWKCPPAWLFVLLLGACDAPELPHKDAPKTPAAVLAEAPVVKPPFEVRGEAEGLLLTWSDEQGAHLAKSRGDIPEGHRSAVRVDSLELSPDKRLDPAFIYVADLSKPGADGSYAVRKVERDAYEASLKPAAKEDDGTAVAKAQGDDVIIYGASWCGACKSAARYLTHKGVPFVEKDIEKEPGARREMQAKADAQGVRTSGIPVIDVYGTLMPGFDPDRMDQLLARK